MAAFTKEQEQIINAIAVEVLAIKELLIEKGLLTDQEIQDRLDKFAQDATFAKTLWDNRHFFDGLRQQLKGEEKGKEG
jgi:hypothetical protein